jgi:maltooligosyltrehalose trehalohydrolase
MIGGNGPFGPVCDYSRTFTQDYFAAANRMWLDEYHVDGFRYDEVADYYFSPTDTAYAKLTYSTYQYSLGIERFRRDAASYSRIIQCAEDLSNPRDILRQMYTNATWQNELLSLSESMISRGFVNADFAHLLDTGFSGYPVTKTVNNAAGAAVDMPVAPFQYLESHDHSQLIVFAGTTGDGPSPPGDRNRWYKLQPFAIALLTLEGIPMLWQGQEFADNYNLPDNGFARIGLRRDTHWEYFYDESGTPLVRLYRRLGSLRRSCRALRSRTSNFYFQQSLQGMQIIAYHRHAAATDNSVEQFVMVLLNFSDSAGTITVPFPKASVWQEMIDADIRDQRLDVPSDNANQTIVVPSNYGCAFL